MAEKVKDICFYLAEPILKEMGYELVEVAYQKESNGMNLIFFIDKEEGITIKDCEIVTRGLEGVLDEANPTKDKPYVLVVSSLGIDRPLKTDRDFQRNMGKEIEIKFYKPHATLKQKVICGELCGYDEKNVKIKNDQGEIEIERNLIANIAPVIKF